MEQTNHKITYTAMKWPSGLKTLDAAAADLGISPERLQYLADNGYAPHYRIDGGAPQFKISDLKSWAAHNLLVFCTGNKAPESIVRVIIAAPAVESWKKVPEELKNICGLRDITNETVPRTGIYFICRDAIILYIGQTTNVSSRIAHHYNCFDFDSVFFLPWPADDLDRIETAFIKTLKPSSNGKTKNGKIVARISNIESDKKLINGLIEGRPRYGIHEEGISDLNPPS